MFIIKNYDHGTQDYAAFECKSYRREFAGEIQLTGQPPRECFSLITDDGTVIKVTGTAYIENENGKTVDTVRAKDVLPPVAMRPHGPSEPPRPPNHHPVA